MFEGSFRAIISAKSWTTSMARPKPPPKMAELFPPSAAAPSKKYEVDDLLITGAKVHVLLTDLAGRR